MHVGEQVAYSPENLRFTRQMGVKYIDTCPDHGMGLEEDGYWHVDAMKRLREEVESYGLELAAMHLPLTSGGIERQIWPNIMLGTPERDRTSKRSCAVSRRQRPPVCRCCSIIWPFCRWCVRPIAHRGEVGSPTAISTMTN